MNMYRKLDCTCGHEHSQHIYCRGYGLDACWCSCNHYDAAGHNPELENVLCPRCRLVRLEKVERHYICIACQYVMLESQVLELVG